jgi:hypothetical protein
VRSLDYDNIWATYLRPGVADWQTVARAHRDVPQAELNGRTVMDVKLQRGHAEHADPRGPARDPRSFRAAAARPRPASVPYQWIIRRQFIGIYLDSNQPSYDPQSSPGLRLQELAPGIQHAVGGSHNSLIVEMKDHVIVFDAPVSDWQSTWTISAARGKYVRKPVKYLVLTHHHMDHAGGIRAYADAESPSSPAANCRAFRRARCAMHAQPRLSPNDQPDPDRRGDRQARAGDGSDRSSCARWTQPARKAS